MTARARTCVQDRRTGDWCAVAGKLDPDAWNDLLLCGAVMVARGMTKRRVPTCPRCLAKLEDDQ